MDTLVDVGGYRLHFHVVAGHGTPIVFEAGGGDDGRVWDEVLGPLEQITGAPLITYDRAGFGTSELDGTTPDPERHGIDAGIAGLETGLRRLGYTRELMLVAHSYGGFYATLFAARHPARVRAAVLIDANLECYYPPDYTRQMMADMRDGIERARTTDLRSYYQSITFARTVAAVRQGGVPESLPITDIVSETPPFRESADVTRWRGCHRSFVAGHATRTGFTASGTGHYVYRDNPSLVILAIAQRYAAMSDAASRLAMLTRATAYAVDAANTARAQEFATRHTENDLNGWGYTLLKRGDAPHAIEVFQLNVSLHPTSANAYDSLGEAYQAAGDRANAIASYEKVLKLDPTSTNARAHLEQLRSGKPDGKMP